MPSELYTILCGITLEQEKILGDMFMKSESYAIFSFCHLIRIT